MRGMHVTAAVAVICGADIGVESEVFGWESRTQLVYRRRSAGKLTRAAMKAPGG